MTAITINAKNRSIELTKTFATASSKFGTPEYDQLQQVRKDYPNYKVVTVTRKATKTDKPSYKGLTYEYMVKYIKSHDKAEENMAEFMELRGVSEEGENALAESAHYQTIKDWFLGKYPEIANFHEKRTALIDEAKQKKEAKKAESVKAKKEALRKVLLEKKTA